MDMQYNTLGRTGEKVSRFGMGCMRLPKQSGDGEPVTDQAEGIRMIRHAIDNGVNYFDTALRYGDSEIVLGKALRDGYRDRVNIATKIPSERYGDFDACLDEELERLQTDRIDFYLFHFLCGPNWELVKQQDLLSSMEEARRRGKIRHIGFSFHDDLSVFKEIIDAYRWGMCQIQLNFLDADLQAGVEGLKYASDRGVGVVIMEPLKGGVLGENVPAEIVSAWHSFPEQRTPAHWAFRWLYNLPETAVILSGVSSMEQLQENIEIFDGARSDSMTAEELALVEQVKGIYEDRIKIPCTGCGYCVPCPQGVDIPHIFKIYNQVFMTGTRGYFDALYKNLMLDHGTDAAQSCRAG
jgi:predicted aldo/keto reductase-like oxidoreductase